MEGGNHEEERRALQTLRWIAGAVSLFLLVFLVIIDSLGRLFVDRNFHVSEVIFGTLGGILLIILGLEGANFFKRNSNGNS
jgi:hypothetical protein